MVGNKICFEMAEFNKKKFKRKIAEFRNTKFLTIPSIWMFSTRFFNFESLKNLKAEISWTVCKF